MKKIDNRVDIVIAMYNSEKYIERCLDSVKKQSFKNYNVHIVDDGSTDNSAKLVQSYCHGDSNFYYYFQENAGVSAARNFGIGKCTNRYLAFIDSDDYIAQNYLETLINLFDSECSMSVSGYTMELVDGTIIKRSILIDSTSVATNTINTLFSENGIRTVLWNKVFLTNIVKKNLIRFDEDIYIGEDLLFIVDYLRYAKNIITTSETLYNYVVHEDSAMQKMKKNNEFNEKWHSEWGAVCKAEKLYSSVATDTTAFFRKKVIVANKLLRILNDTNGSKLNKSTYIVFLRTNFKKIICESDLPVKTRLSIIRNIVKGGIL